MQSDEIDILNLEIERRRQFEPLRFFKPNRAQRKFFEVIKKPDCEVGVFPAGNWTGKTAAAIVLAGALIWPEQAEHEVFNAPLFKNWPYPKTVRIVTTPKEMSITGSIQKEIKRWWPMNGYKPDKQGKLYPSMWTARDWTVDSMTYDQAITEFEGGTIGLFIFNEPPPQNIYDTYPGRMKGGGRVLLPATMIGNCGWMSDKLIASDGRNGIYVVRGATEDNCIEHGENGVIPHQAIENFRNKCDPDEIPARLEGKDMKFIGQIYKAFNRDVHVIKDCPLDSFLSGKQIYHVTDPAIGKPLANIWAALDACGVLTIYQEWPEFEFQGAKDSNMTVLEYANLFKALEGHYKPFERILDRHFGNNRGKPGAQTLKQDFGDEGIDYMDSYSIADVSSEVETGILKVKDLLRYDKTKKIDSLNRPRIQVFESCKNTIHSLERWSRDPKTGKPKEEYKDFADCVRYLAMSSPEPEIERPWIVTPTAYGVNRS